MVSDKFLQYLIDTGIPIASIAGQQVEVPLEIMKNATSKLKPNVSSLRSGTTSIDLFKAGSHGTSTGIVSSNPFNISLLGSEALKQPTPPPMPSKLLGVVSAAASAGLVCFP
jgi:hypothetical protein